MDARTPKSQMEYTQADIRDALKHIKAVTAWKAPKEGYYGCDRSDATEYFYSFRKWLDEIRISLDALRMEGEKIVYVDVSGRATSGWLKADENYSFSLQPADYHWFPKEGVRVCGDFFNPRDYYSFLRSLKEKQPALITFEPVAGMGPYAVFETTRGVPPLLYDVIHERLKKNLSKTIEVLRPGGYIFFAPAFEAVGANFEDWMNRKPHAQYRSTLWVKEICDAYNCSLRAEGNIHGVHWLIRKRKIQYKLRATS